MTISAMIMSLASLLDFNDCEQLFCLSVYRETPGGVKLGFDQGPSRLDRHHQLTLIESR
jgi:hypothetical protein